LIALCFLAGIVWLLALRLAALTFGLPAWVAYKANHPLVASLLVACFLPSTVPPWLGVAMVVLLVALDSLLWPQLRRMMVHPALLVFGILYLVQRQIAIGFVNPFDLRPLDDPLTLWYRLHIIIDPVKLYVGNVPGPLGATSMGALLLGLSYLWYTRKISLGLIGGFVVGIAAASLALRYDVTFQLSSGPALFLAGYLAADRRRLTVDERATLVMGAAAGILTVALRANGQAEQAAWEALLAVGALASLAIRVASVVRGGGAMAPLPGGLRAFTVRSNRHTPAAVPPPTPAPVLAPMRAQSVAVGAGTGTSVRSRPASPRAFPFEASANPDDIVRQMRSAATRRSLKTQPGPWALWVLALIVLNPAGLWMTWTSVPVVRVAKIGVTVASVLWYVGLAALLLARLHRL
jgi:Na+-translocating ferredoxin:NAD+ oxidoreductase subunit D